MWILRLVRNFALLAVLALAAHAAAGADKHLNGHCGGPCGFGLSCPKKCVCVNVGQGSSTVCLPTPR
jgi:hypothetical protein